MVYFLGYWYISLIFIDSSPQEKPNVQTKNKIAKSLFRSADCDKHNFQFVYHMGILLFRVHFIVPLVIPSKFNQSLTKFP